MGSQQLWEAAGGLKQAESQEINDLGNEGYFWLDLISLPTDDCHLGGTEDRSQLGLFESELDPFAAEVVSPGLGLSPKLWFLRFSGG